MRKKLLSSSPALAIAMMLSATAHAQKPQARDIVETAVAAGNFTVLAKLLNEAGLITIMKSPGPFTVFAPTDEAFAKVPKATLDGLAKDKAKLTAVLTYHVLTSKVTADDLKQFKDIGTVEGHRVRIGSSGGTMTIDGAKVVKADIDCANGVIHVVDAVLMPK